MASKAISPRAPGTTNQKVMTPPIFLDAVRRSFGNLIIDWAAETNNVSEVWFGQDPLWDYTVTDANGKEKIKNDDPGSIHLPWGEIHSSLSDGMDDWGWVNPPFSESKRFIKKCAAEVLNGAQILCLVQTATASEYWKRFVLSDPNCKVIFLTGRIPFVGYGNGANIDTSLLVWREEKSYVRGWSTGFQRFIGASKFYLWDWRVEGEIPKWL